MLAYFNNLKMLPLIKRHFLSALFKIGTVFSNTKNGMEYKFLWAQLMLHITRILFICNKIHVFY